jgi:hypothetical protein
VGLRNKAGAYIRLPNPHIFPKEAMQKNLSLAILASLVFTAAASSGCAQLQQAKAHVKNFILLPENEIAAPAGKRQLFQASEMTAEQVLSDATQVAVKVLISTLEHPLSLTAPIKVHTLTSLNPEIVSKNRFGSVAASHISAALAADGYTVSGKSASEAILKNRASIRGTYSQSGTAVTISLEITDVAEKTVLGAQVYAVPIDGAMRKLLDS